MQTPKRVIPQPGRKKVKLSNKNKHMESLGNTKAATKRELPGGMTHSKVGTAPKDMPHGKYL